MGLASFVGILDGWPIRHATARNHMPPTASVDANGPLPNANPRRTAGSALRSFISGAATPMLPRRATEENWAGNRVAAEFTVSLDEAQPRTESGI